MRKIFARLRRRRIPWRCCAGWLRQSALVTMPTATSERYALMLDRLEADAPLRLAFRRHVVHLLASRRLVAFFTDSGILPGTGFFSE